MQKGEGICRTCAGKDPKVAEAAFRKWIASMGASLLEPAYLGANEPHRVRCAAGHLCLPRPKYQSQGNGICRQCAGKNHDALYVLLNEEEGLVKFGITGGDARVRLAQHRRNGYETLVRLILNLREGAATAIERDIIATLALAREIPVKGREYYRAATLALVLDILDNHPDIRPRMDAS